MKNKNKWIGRGLSMLMLITYMMPFSTLMAQTAQIIIQEIIQGTSYVYPEDTFSLTVKLVRTEGSIQGKNMRVSVSGSGVDDSKASTSFVYWEDINTSGSNNGLEEDKKTPVEAIVSGIKYNGSSKNITVSIAYEGGSDSKSMTLSAMTLEETQDMVKVDDTSNILVKAGSTQNAQVKVINQGKQALRNVKVKLTLAEKVEGIKIKTEEAIISSLQSKEVKSAAFSIEVDEEVKAQVYKATVTVNGASFPVNLQVDSHVVPSVLEVSTDSSKIFTPGVAQDTSLTIRNVGERPAKNIRVEISGENVAIVDGSNVKHISVINARSSQNVAMKLRVDAKVKDNTIPVKVEMTYLNSLGEDAKDTQTIF